MHEVETTMLTHNLSRGLATRLKRGDGPADHGGTSFGEFGGDEGDALDVFVAVLTGETEFGRELAAD